MNRLANLHFISHLPSSRFTNIWEHALQLNKWFMANTDTADLWLELTSVHLSILSPGAQVRLPPLALRMLTVMIKCSPSCGTFQIISNYLFPDSYSRKSLGWRLCTADVNNNNTYKWKTGVAGAICVEYCVFSIIVQTEFIITLHEIKWCYWFPYHRSVINENAPKSMHVSGGEMRAVILLKQLLYCITFLLNWISIVAMW